MTGAPSDAQHDEGAVGSLRCASCGGGLEFSPTERALCCSRCGASEAIAESPEPIVEHDFETALSSAATTPPADLAAEGKSFRCDGCGAVAITAARATRCSFCDAPVVLEEASDPVIAPYALLPFAIDKRAALEAFGAWVRSRWFAPQALVRVARAEQTHGVYLPYWTYDARTRTRYVGMRGDHYFETVSSTDSNGNSRSRRVMRTRWRPAGGGVQRGFDDVLVCASNSLPRELLRALEPWDLERLERFQASFLAGLEAERYGVDVQRGHVLATERMTAEIRNDVRADIGGDVQVITSMNTTQEHVRFKHLLLPVWVAVFRFRRRVYNVVVNGRTGEVSGERPYSAAKIALAALGVAAVATAMWWFMKQPPT